MKSELQTNYSMKMMGKLNGLIEKNGILLAFSINFAI
jgi:hypothetical protein